MVNYEVSVYTSDCANATTFNDVFIKLVGTDGESKRERLMGTEGTSPFSRGVTSRFTVSWPVSIGKLVLIELDKQRLPLFPEDSWFPAKVEVKSPEGQTYSFPVYRWITDFAVHGFREGTALRDFDETNPSGKYNRQQELKQRQEDYRWDDTLKGLPHSMKVAITDDPPLPLEVMFSFTKEMEFNFTAVQGQNQLELNGLADCTNEWSDINHLHRVLWRDRSATSDYVREHWREDELLGYQYLNGVNPMLIRRCSVLPGNFPVTDDMVSLSGGSCLTEEMQNGNIFLCDYKRFDGLPGNLINGSQQYLMAPLVLLHKTPDDKMMPIAIQLKQTPAMDNPIFFPTDSEYDWLTAKLYVRSADFSEHQLNVHLLRTHLLAEVFAVSLLRNVPMVHPLYKLLIPHTRYTLQINMMAKHLLISKDGVFTKFAASGGNTMFAILQKSLASVTYNSLCIQDDIAERGLEHVPNFYYRDDGLKLWNIILGFVQGMLSNYYKSDDEVTKDLELQKWISDIFEHGFLSQKSSGIPKSFTTRAEMVKFVTMVIFTGSVQHAAVNSGQYDFAGWAPNTPISLKGPPPTTKGTTNEATMLQILPDVNVTVKGMAVTWLLSRQSSDSRFLGQFPEEHFTEEVPCNLIKDFQEALLKVAEDIEGRELKVPYTYLSPTKVENSVAV